MAESLAKPLEIEQADALCRTEIVVSLTDGRSLLLTLDQLLGAGPRVLPADDGGEDSH